MIKCEDLRIGNLVGIARTKEAALVIALTKDEVRLQKEDGETVSLKYDEIEGIPMTDEVYLKRGFETADMDKMGKGHFYRKDGLKINIFTDDDGQLWCLEHGEDSIELDDRHYMHEMQNALRMLMSNTKSKNNETQGMQK